jgi:hypothetical protein
LGRIRLEKRAFPAESAILVNAGPPSAPDPTGGVGFESAFDQNAASASRILTGRERLFCRMSSVAAFSSAGAAD